MIRSWPALGVRHPSSTLLTRALTVIIVVAVIATVVTGTVVIATIVIVAVNARMSVFRYPAGPTFACLVILSSQPVCANSHRCTHHGYVGPRHHLHWSCRSCRYHDL